MYGYYDNGGHMELSIGSVLQFGRHRRAVKSVVKVKPVIKLKIVNV